MNDRNAAAFVKSITSSVTRCSRCELPVGQPGGPPERYVIVLLNGRTYCEPCAEVTETEPPPPLVVTKELIAKLAGIPVEQIMGFEVTRLGDTVDVSIRTMSSMNPGLFTVVVNGPKDDDK